MDTIGGAVLAGAAWAFGVAAFVLVLALLAVPVLLALPKVATKTLGVAERRRLVRAGRR